MSIITVGAVKDSPTGPEVELTTDDVFHVLSNSRRRHILHVLLDYDRLAKRDLAELVAERNREATIEDYAR